jgi:fluoroacetyl-CoA thioesterase
MPPSARLQPGLVGKAQLEVTAQHTAKALGSGTVEVFASPMMIALMEAAAVDCIARHLAPGEISLGTHLDVAHRRASPVGAKIEAIAELIAVDGRVLTFRVETKDGAGLIGDGRHTRALADETRFMAKLSQQNS